MRVHVFNPELGKISRKQIRKHYGNPHSQASSSKTDNWQTSRPWILADQGFSRVCPTCAFPHTLPCVNRLFSEEPRHFSGQGASQCLQKCLHVVFGKFPPSTFSSQQGRGWKRWEIICVLFDLVRIVPK